MAEHETEFEESEYRGPLYNQLAVGTRRIWEPGQVFEEHIGIDYAMFCRSIALEKHLGWGKSYAGVTLGRYSHLWHRQRPDKKPPPFKLNLFIQAKRSKYITRTPKGFKALGLSAPFWKFDLTHHQQVALEGLEKALGNKAAVVYAAPLFHTSEDLYRYTERGKIIQNSTFPTPSTLQGHEAWNFSVPEWGIANSDPERLEVTSLHSVLEGLGSEEGEQQNALETVVGSLGQLRGATTEAIQGASDFIRARFANEVREIRSILERDFPEGLERTATDHFMTVMTFCDLLRLNWSVIR